VVVLGGCEFYWVGLMRTVWLGDFGFERFIGELVVLGSLVLGSSVTMDADETDE
jgi:hypothetical protein